MMSPLRPLCLRLVGLSIAAALAFAPCGVSAQTPAPAALDLPKANCGTKPEFPGRLASDKSKLQWRKDAIAYVECYKKYAFERRDLSQQMIQRYQDAANAAIAEYNAIVKDVQADVDAANKE